MALGATFDVLDGTLEQRCMSPINGVICLLSLTQKQVKGLFVGLEKGCHWQQTLCLPCATPPGRKYYHESCNMCKLQTPRIWWGTSVTALEVLQQSKFWILYNTETISQTPSLYYLTHFAGRWTEQTAPPTPPNQWPCILHPFKYFCDESTCICTFIFSACQGPVSICHTRIWS